MIEKLQQQGKFETIVMGIRRPYMQIRENGKSAQVFLDDTPRLRQMYHDYCCFRGAKVRLESLNYALKFIHSRKVQYTFLANNNLREISISGSKMIFVYEYCLSQAALMELAPEEDSVIVNLHNWNGEGCISEQAYELAEHMDVKLLTMKSFYEYIDSIK